jgi:hypothetical protein
MDSIEDYNSWLKKIRKIKRDDVSFRIYSLDDKSIQSQNELYDDDAPAFIFVFSYEDVTPFVLMLPLSIIQMANEFYRYAMKNLQHYKEVTLMNFPHGKIWARVDEEYVSEIEDYLGVIKRILKESSEALGHELMMDNEF